MAFIPNEGDAPLDGEQAELDSVDLTIILDGFRLRGVKNGCGVTAGPGALQVTVAPGTLTYDTGADIATGGGVLAIAAAGPHTRFDLVVVNSAGAVSVISGAANWSTIYGPTFPTYSNVIVLAAVCVLSTTTTLAAADIIDKRVMVNLYGGTYTDAKAVAAVAALLTDTATIDLDFEGGVFLADVIPGGVDHNSLANLAVGNVHTQYITKATLVSTGDLLYASGAATPANLSVVVPAANVRNVLGLDNGDTVPAWKTALDSTAPSTSAVGDAAAAGTSLIMAHRDHTHGRESFASPTIALGTAAATGAATTHIRSDATIIAFDVTVPTTSAMGDAAATGVINFAARRDHKHARESFATNAILLGTAASAGAATTPFRSNDTIAAFDGSVPTTIHASDAAATGSIAFAARRDHVHGAPATYPATAHTLIGTTHSDTNAAGGIPVRGDVLIGNSTPAWDRLGLGANGSVFWTNGTDPSWTISPLIGGYVAVGVVAAPLNTTAGDFTAQRLVLGVDTFLSTLPILLYATSTHTASTGSAATLVINDNFNPAASNISAQVFQFTGTITPTINMLTSRSYQGFVGNLVSSGTFNIPNMTGFNMSVLHRSSGTMAGLVGMSFIVKAGGGAGATTEIDGVSVSVGTDATTGDTNTTHPLVRGIHAFIIGKDINLAHTFTSAVGLHIDRPNSMRQTIITTLRGVQIDDLGITTISALTDLIALDIAFQTVGSGVLGGIRNASTTILTPSTSQTLIAATAITANATVIQITAATAITLTSAPTVTIGYGQGQKITIINVGTNNITLQDHNTLASSSLSLSANTITLGPNDSITLLYVGTLWVQIAQVNVL
jgi:hypothetical protein